MAIHQSRLKNELNKIDKLSILSKVAQLPNWRLRLTESRKLDKFTQGRYMFGQQLTCVYVYQQTLRLRFYIKQWYTNQT